jgi:hypothetical protein
VTPLPDQDQIRTDLARGKYHSKLDISDAFEQMRMNLKLPLLLLWVPSPVVLCKLVTVMVQLLGST